MGQCIDLALFDSLFLLLGPLPAEHAAHGRVCSGEGSRSKNSSPRGCNRTRDGHWIAVSGSTPAMAERFLRAYGLDQSCATRSSRPTKRVCGFEDTTSRR